MPRFLYLVRHGEVANPDGVVYADLPEFGLSDLGRRQAERCAERLRDVEVDAIISSPLRRAVETATPIEEALGLAAMQDARLSEWGLATRWAGAKWDRLDDTHPGELTAYLDQPTDLPFSPESIEAVAARMEDAVLSNAGDRVVVISHQDPIQALRLRLTGRHLDRLHEDKPTHACVIALERSREGWHEVDFWHNPLEAPAFPPSR